MAVSEMDAEGLRGLLLAARTRTLLLAQDLNGERLLGPELPIVNPPLWEIGHLGWFQERWCLRYAPDGNVAPSMRQHADELYDSATVAHARRWNLPLPHFEATLDYLQRVLEGVLERIEREGATRHLRYFAQLAAFHEEMHCEAFTYTRQTLGYPAPPGMPAQITTESDPCAGDAEIAGGSMKLGATPDDGFVFDNEKWVHEVEVTPFRIARTPVTNGEFAAFVEDGGYRRPELWIREGWTWRNECGASAPVYWRQEGLNWLRRRYDQWEPLPPDAPIIHVNWFEADAYCRWAGRRLPSEAEWEFAAATAPDSIDRKRRYPWGDAPPPSASVANLYGTVGDCAAVTAFPKGDSAWGCRQMFGNVWEWTADWFGPYPGFVPDPYKEYSAPWFGNHKVLRGGCFATRASLLRNTWRNFYTPDRRDVFAGFRTCAPASMEQGLAKRGAGARLRDATAEPAKNASVRPPPCASSGSDPRGNPLPPSDAPCLRDATGRESGAAPSSAGAASVSGVTSPGVARPRVEEGPFWGSDLAGVQGAGGGAPIMAGSTVASPHVGPLLNVTPAPVPPSDGATKP